MPGWRLHTRSPRGEPGSPASTATTRDPDVLAGFLEDAAHFPGGYAAGLVQPTSEADVVRALRESASVLPIGAQSSLTGGATPFGDVVLGTARLNKIFAICGHSLRGPARGALPELDAAPETAGRDFPPAP